ncbi:MAG: hypothetical protein GTN81_06020 [Proteobacteria bacterium]|nr:hypothetical protein [Pseudomonadota bacterium]
MQILTRRSYPRFEVRKLVSYNHGGKRFLTLTLDLALGGMKIETCRDLPHDEDLDFQLILDNRTIWLKGRPVYNHLVSGTMNIAGIQFLGISEEDRDVLQQYLGRLHQLPGPQGMISARGKGSTTKSRKAGEK